MKRQAIHTTLLMLLLLLANSCKREEVRSRQSMYYWRTTLVWGDEECKRADSMEMQTLYLRLFDVVRDASEPSLGLRPEASLRFPDKEAAVRLKGSVERIVPVVFLAPNTISQADEGKMPDLASLLLKRIDQMTEKNGLGKCQEIQIDFDWAQSNGKVYFTLLECLSDKLHSEGRALSTTIRLHQLALQTPPVDRGVLMCYNTGKIQQIDEPNSILTQEAVEPYLRYLKAYSLPLTLALPRFGWNVVFREGEFAFIAPGLELTDTTAFAQVDDTHWRARTYQAVPGAASATTQSIQRILPGDMIRREDSDNQLNSLILKTMQKKRPDIVREVVWYGGSLQ